MTAPVPGTWVCPVPDRPINLDAALTDPTEPLITQHRQETP